MYLTLFGHKTDQTCFSMNQGCGFKHQTCRCEQIFLCGSRPWRTRAWYLGNEHVASQNGSVSVFHDVSCIHTEKHSMYKSHTIDIHTCVCVSVCMCLLNLKHQWFCMVLHVEPVDFAKCCFMSIISCQPGQRIPAWPSLAAEIPCTPRDNCKTLALLS
jgi:hypothetical protein